MKERIKLSESNFKLLKSLSLEGILIYDRETGEYNNTNVTVEFYDESNEFSTSDIDLVLTAIMFEVASEGMDETQNYVNDYGIKLNALYDEIVYQ